VTFSPLDTAMEPVLSISNKKGTQICRHVQVATVHSRLSQEMRSWLLAKRSLSEYLQQVNSVQIGAD